MDLPDRTSHNLRQKLLHDAAKEKDHFEHLSNTLAHFQKDIFTTHSVAQDIFVDDNSSLDRLAPEWDQISSGLHVPDSLYRYPYMPVTDSESYKFHSWHTDYWISSDVQNDNHDTRLREFPYSSFKVSCIPDCTTKRLYLLSHCRQYQDDESVQCLFDTMKEWLNLLVETINSMVETNIENIKFEIRYIVRLFLWSVWNRSLTIYQALYVEKLIDSDKLRIVGAADLYRPYFRTCIDKTVGSDRICYWAFRVFSSSAGIVNADFSALIKSYNSRPAHIEFGCKAPGHKKSSCGLDLGRKCYRQYTRAGKKNKMKLSRCSQLMHTKECKDKESCSRIYWNTASFNGAKRLQAIRALPGTAEAQYCTTSSNTMAISHVWTHGQGGSPDMTGMNQCLYKFYCKIAMENKCDSFWMDTLCIPEHPSHETLRQKGIRDMNEIFSTAGFALVSDRDVMNTETDELESSMEGANRLLASILLCDWGTRGWTLLEGIRGRSLQFLCSTSGRIFQLKEIVRQVLGKHNLALAGLCLSLQQYLRVSTPLPLPHHVRRYSMEESDELLSGRRESRGSDRIIIWGLLNGRKPDEFKKDPYKLWELNIGEKVRTGYLMLDRERLRKTPFRWAPTLPKHNRETMFNTKVIKKWDGTGTSMAEITKDGLRGRWRVHDMDDDEAEQLIKRWTPLRFYRQKCLLQPLQELTSLGIISKETSPALTTVAYCGLDSMSKGWVWHGLHQVESGLFARLSFVDKEILLI